MTTTISINFKDDDGDDDANDWINSNDNNNDIEYNSLHVVFYTVHILMC